MPALPGTSIVGPEAHVKRGSKAVAVAPETAVRKSRREIIS
jgi:hypothetical protein